MIEEPRCRKRKCIHYVGTKQDNEDELTERPFCKAFPDGIPEVIAYGPDLHLTTFNGDHGIQYERA